MNFKGEKNMLILMRKKGSSFTVGDEIRVRVLNVEGEYVRLGIDAPKDLKIMRDDIINRKPPAPQSAK